MINKIRNLRKISDMLNYEYEIKESLVELLQLEKKKLEDWSEIGLGFCVF